MSGWPAVVALVLTLTVVRPILTRPAPAVTVAGAIAGPATASGGPHLAGVPAGSLPQPDQPGLPPPEGGEKHPVLDGDALRLAVAERPEQTVSMLQEWLTPTELPVRNEEAA